MALNLIATAGAANANAYADVAAADLAATYRIGGADWIALTPDQKIQALVTGAGDIDSIEGTQDEEYIVSFPGDKTNEDQALQWPRGGDTELPANLVKANIELAFSYVPAFADGFEGDVLNADTRAAQIKREKLDVIETEYFEAGASATGLARLPAIVQRWLSTLLDYTLITPGYGTGTAMRSS